jgi:hypothetical protein
MKYKLGFVFTITFWLGAIPRLVAGADGFAGDWMLSFDQGRGAQHGLLEIREADGGFVAYVEGGPVTISVDGADIEVGVDDRTGAGEPYVRHLLGTLNGDVMEGGFGPETPSEFCQQFPLSCDVPSGVWWAERIVETLPQNEPPRPVDLSGVWGGARGGGGISRYTMDLTPKAQAWVDEFNAELDFPAQRCVSSGLFRRFTSGLEIWRYASHFTFLYSGGEVRRIYTDGRSRPDYIFPSPMGHSLGTWDGSTLVVETTGLQPAVRGYRGEPISENARFVERYTLSEDGASLTGLLTLHDPENYRRPPLRRMSWNQSDPGVEAGPMVSCDPDSFYRQLYEDGKMQKYIDRSDQRL